LIWGKFNPVNELKNHYDADAPNMASTTLLKTRFPFSPAHLRLLKLQQLNRRLLLPGFL
jgi:hypothetical protein